MTHEYCKKMINLPIVAMAEQNITGYAAPNRSSVRHSPNFQLKNCLKAAQRVFRKILIYRSSLAIVQQQDDTDKPGHLL